MSPTPPNIELWQVAVMLAAMLTGWSGIILGVIWRMLSRSRQDMDRRMADLAAAATHSQQVEKDLLSLRAELPLCYVRKEDSIRTEAVFNIKLDRLADKIDSLRQEQK